MARRLTSTQGSFPTASLEYAQQALVDLGLVTSVHGKVLLSEAMSVIVGLDDQEALALLERHWMSACQRERGRPLPVEQRERIGSVGEELVTHLARAELQRVGRGDLAQQVQRVSLVDDGLGYDVRAPTLHGTSRLMEVKSSTAARTSSFGFFLSRNEYEVGLSSPTLWALVACHVGEGVSVEDSRILGWSPVGALRLYVPEDGNGRWTEAYVRLPQATLTPGLPPAT